MKSANVQSSSTAKRKKPKLETKKETNSEPKKEPNTEVKMEPKIETKKPKSKIKKTIIALFSVTIILLALSSVVAMNFQSQLNQKDNQIQSLQDQIDETALFLGPISKGTWSLVESFGGDSELTTEYFYVSGIHLRMNWTSFSGEGEPMVLNFSICKEEQSEYVASFSNLETQGTTFLLNVEKTNYYLQILVENIDQWTLTVETWIPE